MSVIVITPLRQYNVGDVLTVQRVLNNNALLLTTGDVVPPFYTLPLNPHPKRHFTMTFTPEEGWDAYVRAAGVYIKHYGNNGIQFYARFWGDTLAGKTGGLHMSPMGSCVRRCQFSVETGVRGANLRHVIAGTKAGMLVYVGNITNDTLQPCGLESTARLSFTALLLTYVEMVSEVRRRVYSEPSHPLHGIDYESRVWDHTHKPTSAYFYVHSKTGTPRKVFIRELAHRRAENWILLEQIRAPSEWGLHTAYLLCDATTQMWVTQRHKDAVKCCVYGSTPRVFEL